VAGIHWDTLKKKISERWFSLAGCVELTIADFGHAVVLLKQHNS